MAFPDPRSIFAPRRLPVACLALCLAALPLAACGGADEPDSVVPEGGEAAGEPTSTDQADAGDAGGFTPVRAGGPSGPNPPAGAAAGATSGATTSGDQASGAGIRWTWPEGWTVEPPASSMRLAQAEIPGDAGPATLAVFHFGPGGGGGVDANIDRWVGQVEATGEPERQEFTVGDGYRVTWVEVAGTLKPSMMGTGPAEPQPDSRLLGAVVEGPGGPWFFKATGPGETLAAARDDFRALLDGLEPAG